MSRELPFKLNQQRLEADLADLRSREMLSLANFKRMQRLARILRVSL